MVFKLSSTNCDTSDESEAYKVCKITCDIALYLLGLVDALKIASSTSVRKSSVR